jgi:hypothetical protein
MSNQSTPYAPSVTDALIKALQVLVLDPRTRRYLETYDLTALAQAREALRQAGQPATEAEVQRANAAAWRRHVEQQQAHTSAADQQRRD